MNRLIGFPLLSLSLAVLVGCGDKEKLSYANVSGTVNYNGKPIEKGQITFAIEGRPPSTMDIVDGKFNGSAMVGQNRVMVSAKKKGNAQVPARGASDADAQIKGYMDKKKGEFGGPPADYDPTMVEYIPQEWGMASRQTRVVESGAENKFDFDIKGTDKK
jgi:hypothetical protein